MLRALFHGQQNTLGPLDVPVFSRNGRMAGCKGPGLVQHHRINVFGDLKGIRVFDQDAQAGTLSDTGHNGRRGRQAQGAGTGDDQHGNHVQQGLGKASFGGKESPADKGSNRQHKDHGYEDGGDLVHQPLDARLASLRLLHQADDAGKHRILPHLLCLNLEGTLLVQGAGIDLIAHLLENRSGFTRKQAFIHVRFPLNHHAIHRDPLTGFHAYAIAHAVFFLARPQFHQVSYGPGGAVFGPFFQDASDQDERHNHGTGVEVQGGCQSFRCPETRENQGKQAEQPGNQGR